MGGDAYTPSKSDRFIRDANGNATLNPLVGQYNDYLSNFSQVMNPNPGELSAFDPYAGTGALSWKNFSLLSNMFGNAIPSGNLNSTGFNSFNIAKNPMSTGMLPTMKEANTSADLYNKYSPAPFTLEANTPKVVPMKRGLTYNNPYNTNPYLPLVNPFALIANTPTSGS